MYGNRCNTLYYLILLINRHSPKQSDMIWRYGVYSVFVKINFIFIDSIFKLLNDNLKIKTNIEYKY